MEKNTEITVINAPYGKTISLNEVSYENGFSMIRMRIREGKRFTDMDLDANTIRLLNQEFHEWLNK